MRELANGRGANCVRLDSFRTDGQAWAISVAWRCGAEGLPDRKKFVDAIEALIADCKTQGARSIGSRVITAAEGVPDGLASQRAALHRDTLVAFGFDRGEDRVEYRVDLKEAVSAIDASAPPSDLIWESVATGSDEDLALAADIYHQACEGDPAFDPDEDPLGFLEELVEDDETVQSSEQLQIGWCDGDPAAFLALMVDPVNGWSTFYYLGVLPAFRGRGFGAAAMAHGLRSLDAMGGKTYHDGTAAMNAPALALFARLGRPPFRTMEEWRLRL